VLYTGVGLVSARANRVAIDVPASQQVQFVMQGRCAASFVWIWLVRIIKLSSKLV
jgi:hypothetical protein